VLLPHHIQSVSQPDGHDEFHPASEKYPLILNYRRVDPSHNIYSWFHDSFNRPNPSLSDRARRSLHQEWQSRFVV
jgi:hypothetical protein